jgi:hypothetical protein
MVGIKKNQTHGANLIKKKQSHGANLIKKKTISWYKSN